MNTFDNFLIVKVPNPNIQLLKNIVRQNWLTNGIKNVFYDYIFSGPSLLNEFRDLRIREDRPSVNVLIHSFSVSSTGSLL